MERDESESSKSYASCSHSSFYSDEESKSKSVSNGRNRTVQKRKRSSKIPEGAESNSEADDEGDGHRDDQTSLAKNLHNLAMMSTNL